MDPKFPFRFSLPDLSGGRMMTAGEAEKRLLSAVKQKQSEFENAIWQLVRLYSMTGRLDDALAWIQILMSLTSDSEKQASYYLAIGQLMEKRMDFQAAIDFYTQVIALNPTARNLRYFANNNIGYSLNQLGHHAEAEPYCRSAIEVDPDRHNAYKNLGVSLEGQGDYLNAAEAYLRAVEKEAGDPRALAHLRELLGRHPEILEQRPDLKDRLRSGEEAVEFAAKLQKRFARTQIGQAPKGATRAIQILYAVAHIVFREGRSTFTREDVRRQIGVSREEWRNGYTAIFQAMRADHPGGAPKIRKEYRGLFKRVERGTHTLTEYGRRYIQSGKWRIVHLD